MIQTLQYEFQLNLQRLYIDINFQCSVQIWWKKGKSKITSKLVRITQPVHYIDFNDTLKIKAKCKSREGKIAPYETSIQVLLYPLNGNQCKSAGAIQSLDVIKIMNPHNIKAHTSKQLTTDLINSPQNSKLVYLLSCTFLREVNEESIGDISFQANSQSLFNRNGPISPLPQNNGQNGTDMTFRPPSSSDDRTRKTSRRQMQTIKQDRGDRKDYKINRDSRQGREYNNRNEIRNQLRPTDPPKLQGRVEQPLGFSFGPFTGQQSDKQKQIREMLETINELNRESSQKQRQIDRLQAIFRQIQQQRNGIDDKKLQLINQLNANINQVDQLKRERVNLNIQLSKYKQDLRQINQNNNKMKDDLKQLALTNSKLREENRQLATNFSKLRDQSNQQLDELSSKFDSKRKQYDDLKQRYDKTYRENQQMKNQLFKKQSQLISNQSRLEQIKNQFNNKTVTVMDDLKRVNQDLGRQKSELQKILSQKIGQITKQQQNRQSFQNNCKRLENQLKVQQQKLTTLTLLFEEKQKNNHNNISEIEEQMHQFMQELHEKDCIIADLQRRLNEEAKKYEAEGRKNESVGKDIESYQIQISELKVKIKHLQQICINLQKDCSEREKQLAQKVQLIEKAREYVTKMESQAKEKDDAIKERDQFIARAKIYITNRQKQLLDENQKIKQQLALALNKQKQSISIQKITKEYSQLSIQSQQKQKFLQEVMEEANRKQDRIDQLEQRLQEIDPYIQMLQERIQLTQDEMEELVRKIRSQEETLEDVVKKKLDLEIMVSVKQYEIKQLKNSL